MYESYDFSNTTSKHEYQQQKKVPEIKDFYKS